MKLRTYCLACRKHANIITYCLACRKHTNKVIRDKSGCAQYLTDKFLKQKLNKKVVIKYYKTNMLTYSLVCKKIQRIKMQK